MLTHYSVYTQLPGYHVHLGYNVQFFVERCGVRCSFPNHSQLTYDIYDGI